MGGTRDKLRSTAALKDNINLTDKPIQETLDFNSESNRYRVARLQKHTVSFFMDRTDFEKTRMLFLP